MLLPVDVTLKGCTGWYDLCMTLQDHSYRNYLQMVALDAKFIMQMLLIYRVPLFFGRILCLSLKGTSKPFSGRYPHHPFLFHSQKGKRRRKRAWFYPKSNMKITLWTASPTTLSYTFSKRKRMKGWTSCSRSYFLRVWIPDPYQ